jgi:hypothetical protein
MILAMAGSTMMVLAMAAMAAEGTVADDPVGHVAVRPGGHLLDLL